MNVLLNDARYGFRQLVKNPGFTVVAVMTLAIGIGANITMFSVVNAVLLRPLPFEDSDRLVVVGQHSRERGRTFGFSYPDFADWKEQGQIFETFAAYTQARLDLVEGQETVKIDAAMVSTNFFAMLGTSASLGRTFNEADERQESGPVAVISHEFWQDRFGKGTEVLGRTVTLQDKVYTVVGVLPRGFQYPEVLQDAEVWTVLNPTGDRLTNRGLCWLSTAGRLQPGVSLEQARDRLNQWFSVQGDDDTEVAMAGLHDTVVRRVRTTLWILSVIVGFILLIVCANVANLCLGRASTRDKEIAVRAALGAGKLRLLRQLTTESLLLSLAGGVTGLIVTVWMMSILKVKVADFLPMSETIRVEPSVLLFGLGLSTLVGLLLGVAPFGLLQQTTPVQALTERRQTSGRRAGLSNLLVAVQIAVALVLTMGMTLMIRSMIRLSRENVGFNRDNLVTFNVGVKGMNGTQRYQFSQEFLTRLAALPSVHGTATDSSMPSSPLSSSAPVSVEGYEAPDDKPIRVIIHNVSEDYFKTLQLPLLRGRDITFAEHQKKDSVVLVNESLARIFWPGQDPMGRQLDFCGERYQVIGVVADMIQGVIKEERPNHLFFPFDRVWPQSELKIVVRTDAEPGELVQQARAMLRNIDATLPLYDVSTFKAQMNRWISQERLTTTFLIVFASIALLLIVIGIYGVVSYAVAQRTREIGIRMALGAQKTTILRMILRQGLTLLAIGLVVGIAGAIGLTRFLSSYLYGVSATDPLTFTMVSVVLAGVTLLACLVPAHRAARIDPMEALRDE